MAKTNAKHIGNTEQNIRKQIVAYGKHKEQAWVEQNRKDVSTL